MGGERVTCLDSVIREAHAGKTMAEEDYLAIVRRFETGIAEATADKQRIEDELLGIQVSCQRRAAELPVAREKLHLETRQRALKEERERLLIMRAEITSWGVGCTRR